MGNDLESWKRRALKAEEEVSNSAKVMSEMHTIQKEFEAEKITRKRAEKKVSELEE